MSSIHPWKARVRWMCVLAAAMGSLMLGPGCEFPVPDPNGNDNNGNDNIGNGNGVPRIFAGAQACSTCHAGVHDNWLSTLHAGALETLESAGHGSNGACLPCHTVGFGEGGFESRLITPELAGVQCENCHGPSAAHAADPGNPAFRPTVTLSSSSCGACHTGAHHPTFEQWEESRHSFVNQSVANSLIAGGASVNNCGMCHSGDVFVQVAVKGETVPEDAFAGQTPAELNAITCVVCHDPHAQTGFAAAPDEGRDFQLRFRQAASPTPSNAIEDVTNPQRFNLCGQCHHSRGRTWETSSRPPHHSNQANVYAGEMPISDILAQDPLVLSRVSVHSFATEQCSTCHMYREDFQSDVAPVISGHTFAVNNAGCASAGCHPSAEQAIAAQATLQAEVSFRLNAIANRLGPSATWEYTSEGGPDNDGQAALSDEVKKIRFLYYYAKNDGSLGVHNPAYVRSMLEKAEDMLEDLGR